MVVIKILSHQSSKFNWPLMANVSSFTVSVKTTVREVDGLLVRASSQHESTASILCSDKQMNIRAAKCKTTLRLYSHASGSVRHTGALSSMLISACYMVIATVLTC